MILVIVLALSAAIVAVLHFTCAGDLLHRHISDTPRRRILLSSIASFLTFAGVHGLTWSIPNNVGPLHDIHMGGRHIHHLVWGILLPLFVGYGWMMMLEVRSFTASGCTAIALHSLWSGGSADP